MAGRKPKPTKLKILNGNPGNRKLNKNEPQPVADLFHPPEWFDDDQKSVWKYAIDNAPAGVLGSIDREVLAIWCTSNVIYRQAHEMQKKVDAKSSLPMIVKRGQGYTASPYIMIMNEQGRMMLRAASELGFTPSARTRLTVNKAPGADNPFSRYGRS